MVRRAALAATLLFALSTASASAATETTVQTKNFFFDPATATITLGSPVNWQNQTTSTNHGSKSDLAGLWFVTANHGTTSADVTFNFAGSFAYTCTVHANMHGTIKVKMAAAPTSAPLGTNFTITWATAGVPSGYVFDVQRKKPNKPFKTWFSGTSFGGAKFVPARKGTFQFKARLRKVGGAATGYSPNLAITVN